LEDFLFSLPNDFADHEWEVKAKGWFSGARLTSSGKSYLLNFYDAVRIGQEITSELERGGMFFEPNLLIIPSVTRAEMERAVELLMRSRQVASLIPE